MGLHLSVALLRCCLGWALLESGELVRAGRELTLAAEWLAPRSPSESIARTLLALCALAEPAVDEAELHAVRAVERGRDYLPGLAAALGCLARVKLLRGHSSEAAHLADEAMACLEADAGVSMTDAFVRRTYIEVHDALGHREAANRQLAIASKLLRDRAARIDEPAWKASFLAANHQRAILALAAERDL